MTMWLSVTTMATNGREARRRKIVERGSDRLALITGRIHTIPDSSLPSPSLDPQPHSQDADPSTQPLIFHHQDHVAVKSTVSPHGEDEVSDFTVPKHYPTADAGQTENDFGGSGLVPPLSKCENIDEAPRDPASEFCEVRPSLDSSMDQNSSVSTLATDTCSEPQMQQHTVFTPKHISSAIVETESTRLCCSIAVGLLVVLSGLGFGILGSNIIQNILSFRPFYLVLLTNVTFVLARILKQRGSGRINRGENRSPSAEGNDWTDHVGNALELGLLMQKVLNSVFMDFAVFATIVVCGLSFVQPLH